MRYDEYEGNWSPDGDEDSDPALPIPPSPRGPNAPDQPEYPAEPGAPEDDGDDLTEYWTPPAYQAWSPAFGGAAVGLDALSSLSAKSSARGASRPLAHPLRPLPPYASVDSISGSAVPTPRQRQRQALRGWITFAVFTLLLCGMLGGMLGLINPGTRNYVAHYAPGLAYQTPTPASNSDVANPTPIPSPTPPASPTPTPPTRQRPTPTPTLRPGVTPSPTSVVTATATTQPTATSTPPPTATGTTPPTATAQPTATTQPTATATAQPTATSTATSTAQPTPTQTSTPAPTATATDTPPPTSTATPSATPPGSTPTPTITPTVPPGTATVRLTAASKSYSTNPAMTACAGGGCTLSDQVITASHAESDTWQATWVGQTQLGGYINIYMTSGKFLFFNGWVAPAGNGWYCPRYNVNINFVQGARVYCYFSVGSPNYLAPGTIAGNCIFGAILGQCSQNANVAWSSQAFRGNNGYWLETQAQCNNAINDTESRGRTWSHDYVNTHVESGGTLGYGPHTTFSNVGCNPGPGSNQQYFTASSVANAFGLAYYPADAQSVARQRLIANTLPNGYAWTYQSTCAPSTSGHNGTTLNLSCGENGVAAYDWTVARKSTLSGQLAGQTVSAATSACNATYGVAAGSCSISVQNGSILPSNPAQITMVVTTPTSASNANRPPGGAAASPSGLYLPISAVMNPLTDPPPFALFGSLALALITLAWTRRRLRR